MVDWLIKSMLACVRLSFGSIVALRPKSTLMVMVGQSVRLTTLFSWASLNKQLNSTSCTYFRL